MPKRHSRPNAALKTTMVIVLIVGSVVLLAGVSLAIWRFVGRKGNPFVSKELNPDPQLVEQLQSSEYRFKQAKVSFRLPRDYQDDGVSVDRENWEERPFVNWKLNPGVSAARIWVHVATLVDGNWKKINKTPLEEYIDVGVIGRIKQGNPREVSKVGEAEIGKINGVKFIRQVIEIDWGSWKERQVLYFGVAKPYLITFRCHAKAEKADEWLPLQETAVRTVKW